MAIREFAYPHSPAEYGVGRSAPLPVKANLKKRPLPIDAAGQYVRKANVLAKHPCVSVDWYESEDRTLPSVSSF